MTSTDSASQARLTPIDATMYWLSARISSDQFLLYAFDGHPDDWPAAVDALLTRAATVQDLQRLVDDSGRFGFPRLVTRPIDPGQVVVHELPADDWSSCLDAVAGLMTQQLDARRTAWRMHLFPSVSRVPGADGPATVAVFQIIHAIADGTRASALAAALFGPAEPPAAIAPAYPGSKVAALWEAARARWQQARPTGLVPALSSNAGPSGPRALRTLVGRSEDLGGPTVMAGALAAIGSALGGYLGDRGDDLSTLSAEVPFAKASSPRTAYNNFHSRGVGLHPDVAGSEERALLIADELAAGRRLVRDPAVLAADRAFASVPAFVRRHRVSRLDLTTPSAWVKGNTVVSAVHRGAGNLRFGGRPVVMTAGYPAIWPGMGVTHGVHTIGDTTAISVHAASSGIADIDEYVDRLASAVASLRRG